MTMPDDFNPNMPEPMEKACPECGFDGDEGMTPDESKIVADAMLQACRQLRHLRLTCRLTSSELGKLDQVIEIVRRASAITERHI
jgi:hypothetical protein